ncbi:MAG: protein-L-isoaspartate(D-aspartate) O-methyltransferase [Chloroflexota bacterium]
MDAEERYVDRRERMVAEQIARRMIDNQRVLEAMRTVPRHRFVPAEFVDKAYEDRPLQIGESQTISQPYIVGLMTELLALRSGEVVLEVGTGSGYQSAVLAELVQQVYTIERHQSLADQARKTLAELGFQNVTVIEGDGSGGLPEHAPYDGILVTAAAPEVPREILEQLKDGGRLVIPVGGYGGQTLELWQRKGDHFEHQSIVPVAFVPLRGEHGWEKDWYD